MTTSNAGLACLSARAMVRPETPPPTTTQRGPATPGRSAARAVRPLIAAIAGAAGANRPAAVAVAATATPAEPRRNRRRPARKIPLSRRQVILLSPKIQNIRLDGGSTPTSCVGGRGSYMMPLARKLVAPSFQRNRTLRATLAAADIEAGSNAAKRRRANSLPKSAARRR